jgi:hypothetical protein
MTWNQLAAATTPPAPPPMPAPTNSTTALSSNVVIVKTSYVATTTIGTGTTTVSIRGFPAPGSFIILAISVAGILTVAANLVALSWFGMWMGLTSRSTNLAALKTIAFVQIIPWFAVSFASALIVPVLLVPRLIFGGGGPPTQFMIWYPLLTSGVATMLYLVKDVAFIGWARRKLHSEIRLRAARTVSPTRMPPPPLPKPGAPPVIAPA